MHSAPREDYDGRNGDYDGRNWKEDRFYGKKAPKFPWDIWNAVRFIFKYSILRELRFITLSVFPVFANQIARFLEWARHLIFPVVNRKGQNSKKSQSKIDQNFGRNRKTAKKGVIVIFPIYYIISSNSFTLP